MSSWLILELSGALLLFVFVAAGGVVLFMARTIAESPHVWKPLVAASLAGALFTGVAYLFAMRLWPTHHYSNPALVITLSLGLVVWGEGVLRRVVARFVQPAHDHLTSLEEEKIESNDWQSAEWRAQEIAREEAEHGRSYTDAATTVKLQKRERRRPHSAWALSLRAWLLARLFDETYAHVLYLLTEAQEEPRRRYELAAGKKLA